MIETLASYKFPTAEVGLASLSVRIEKIASRLGVRVPEWLEDGLGPACGFAFRVVSGRVFVLMEHELSIRYENAQGPDLLVDASDLATFGPDALITESVEALGLSRSDLTWVADCDSQQAAAELAAKVRNQSGQ